MKLPPQTVAAALGLALAALGLSDLGFVLLTHAAWVPHASSEVGLIGLGVGLIWWARRPTAGGRSLTSDRSPAGAAIAEAPDRANAVIAVTFGSVLLLIGATVGLLFSLVFGALRGIEVFLAPWGVAGAIAVGVGASRLVSIHRSEQATDRAWIAIARTAETSSPVAGIESAASADAARLLSLHHEAVEAVRQAYETSLPSLRASVQLGVGLFLFVGLYLAWSLVTGAAAHLLPLPSVVNDALTVAAAAFLAFAGGAQSLARLRALELARVELRAGRAPAEWAVGGSIPFRILIGFLRHPLSSPPQPSTQAEDSLLASSLTLLRFGRRLASRVRGLHIAIFLLIFFVGSGAALFSALIVLVRFHGPSAPVPLVVASEWGPVLALMAVAVVYLRRRLGAVDAASRRLAQLETAEVELAGSFWSRF